MRNKGQKEQWPYMADFAQHEAKKDGLSKGGFAEDRV